jgi:hypothetical protein
MQILVEEELMLVALLEWAQEVEVVRRSGARLIARVPVS